MASHRIMPSPLLLVWQLPPKPDHSVFVFTGPYWSDPVLLYTANFVFTSSTYCVRPAAPLLSGGAEPLAEMPSKFTVGCGIRGGPAGVPDVSRAWTTFDPNGRALRWAG